jgi:hypothetical protein
MGGNWGEPRMTFKTCRCLAYVVIRSSPGHLAKLPWTSCYGIPFLIHPVSPTDPRSNPPPFE